MIDSRVAAAALAIVAGVATVAVRDTDSEARISVVRIGGNQSDSLMVRITGKDHQDSSFDLAPVLDKANMVVRVDIRSIRLRKDGREAVQLKRLSSLERVRILDSRIDADSLQWLSTSRSLQRLDIQRCKIAKSGLASLQETSVSELDVEAIDLAEVDLSPVWRLKRLSRLSMTYCILPSKTGLLAELQDLDYLSLDGSHFGLRWLEEIAKLRSINHLTLRETDIGDEAIAPLLKMKSLSILRLDLTNITDRSIHGLAEMPQLSVLGINKTRVTPAGIEGLRTKRPDLAVIYFP